MDTIYLINFNYQHDGYNGWYWDETTEYDYGFFTSKEEAEALCAKKNDRMPQYEAEVSRIVVQNKNAQKAFDTRNAEYQFLVDAGKTPTNPKPTLRQTPVPSYEEFNKKYTVEQYYDVLEVSAHKDE